MALLEREEYRDFAPTLAAEHVETDSTAENLWTLRGWLELYGRPLALYTDKNSIFQTARPADPRSPLEKALL